MKAYTITSGPHLGLHLVEIETARALPLAGPFLSDVAAAVLDDLGAPVDDLPRIFLLNRFADELLGKFLGARTADVTLTAERIEEWLDGWREQLRVESAPRGEDAA